MEKKNLEKKKGRHVSDIEKLKIFVKLDLQSTVGIDLFTYEKKKIHISSGLLFLWSRNSTVLENTAVKHVISDITSIFATSCGNDG